MQAYYTGNNNNNNIRKIFSPNLGFIHQSSSKPIHITRLLHFNHKYLEKYLKLSTKLVGRFLLDTSAAENHTLAWQ
jgi:hypothetical protein